MQSEMGLEIAKLYMRFCTNIKNKINLFHIFSLESFHNLISFYYNKKFIFIILL